MNDVKHDGDDLFEFDSDEQADNGIDQTDVSIEASTNEDELFTEESTSDNQRSAAEIKREEMIESTVLKLRLGETTLKEVASKQRWLAQEASKRMNKEEKQTAPEVDSELIKRLVREEAEKANKEQSEKQHVKNVVDVIAKLSLPKNTLKALNETYKAYRDKLGDREAIDLAVQLHGVDLDNIKGKREEFGIFQTGGSVKEHDDGDLDPNNATAEQREAYMRKRGMI